MDSQQLFFLAEALDACETLDFLAEPGGEFSIVHANPAARSTFERFAGMFAEPLGGIDARAIVGQPLWRLCRRKEQQRAELAALSSGSSTPIRQHEEFGTFLFSMVIGAVRDPSGRCIALHASLRNISARREAVELNDRLKAALSALMLTEEDIGESMVAVEAAMHRVGAVVGDNGARVGELLRDIASIGSLVGNVRAISQQTSLLALNAAIEAARAGSAGRGFGVVADEVRNLAGRVREATEGIASSVESVTSRARQIEQSSRASRQEFDTVDAVLDKLQARIDAMRPLSTRMLLRAAEEDHHNFAIRVMAEADQERPQLTPEAIPDHHTCSFGSWYDDTGRRLFGDRPEFRAIEAPHAALHATARRMLGAAHAGDRGAVARLTTEFLALEKAVLAGLQEVAAGLPQTTEADVRATGV